MFNNSRYLTSGVVSTIPLELQLFLWNCVDELPTERDYLQVFNLEPFGKMQRITHTSENPSTKWNTSYPQIHRLQSKSMS